MNPFIEQYETLIDQVLQQGYGILDNFVTPTELSALNNSLEHRYKEAAFKKAGISKEHEVISEIRGDEIFWLGKSSALDAEAAYLSKIEDFMAYLNQTCYLGLKSYELHYAVYPIGAFYKKHLDRFKSDSGRKMTTVFYLNEEWTEADGGQLRLYLNEGTKDILPIGGRMAIFESDKIEHEVLPSLKERRSITGWLKTTPEVAVF